MRGSRDHLEGHDGPEDVSERNSLEEAAHRYDTDQDFQKTVDGDGAHDLQDEDLDFDAIPELREKD